MSKIVNFKNRETKVREHNAGEKELELYIRGELMSKDKVPQKVNARIDETLKMIRGQREVIGAQSKISTQSKISARSEDLSIQKEVIAVQDHKEENRVKKIKVKQKKIVRRVAVAAGMLIVGLSVWQRSAIIHAAGELYYYIYGEGKVAAEEMAADAVYYSDQEIDLGEGLGVIKFVSWHDNKLVFIRYCDEFAEGWPSPLMQSGEQFQYSKEETDSLFYTSYNEDEQFYEEIVKEVYHTDKADGETIAIQAGGKKYSIKLEKPDLHQAGEMLEEIKQSWGTIRFLPLGNTGRAYYIDTQVNEQFSDYELNSTWIKFLSDKESTQEDRGYFRFDDMLYFNGETKYDKMWIQSELEIDFMEMGYENLPRMALPVPKDGETIPVQKDYYAGTKDGKDYTIYVDNVYRRGNTYFVQFAKDKEEKEMQQAANGDQRLDVWLELETSYMEFAGTFEGRRDSGLGELEEISMEFQDGMLEEFYQNGQTLPFVCTGLNFFEMMSVDLQ